MCEELSCMRAEPKSYKHMLPSPLRQQWQSAVDEELNSLIEMNTWEVVKTPLNQPIVKCRWVFKIKTNSNGSIERYKARLVTKGFTQTKGIDYHETFAPVIKFNTLRFILATAASHKSWVVHQMDVKTAFLYGELNE